MKPLLARLASGISLGEVDASAAFELMMNGEVTPAQIGAFLMGLRLRGETVEEITAAARVLRAKATQLIAPPGAIDVCGTGGDSSGSLNISTAVAVVVAACGVPVAKHGNQAISSRSGSADVLTALGVNIHADLALQQICLAENNLCFMMAPRHHSAMRHVAQVRDELGMRTLFNLLGPLSNPAGTKRQLVGVFAERWVAPMAQALSGPGWFMGRTAWTN
jgi:anthranilate phosphoribosyltransferase